MIAAASSQGLRSEWFEKKGRYGFVKTEYADLVQEALEAQQKEAARAYDSLAERINGGGASVRLTGEQKTYLSENFDPENMSKLEYQAFIDKLCEFGVLEEADKDYVGYGVKGCGLDMRPVGSVRTGGYLSPARENPMGYTDAFSSSRGNVSGWARYLSGVMSWDRRTNSWQKRPESILFGRISDVLNAISK